MWSDNSKNDQRIDKKLKFIADIVRHEMKWCPGDGIPKTEIKKAIENLQTNLRSFFGGDSDDERPQIDWNLICRRIKNKIRDHYYSGNRLARETRRLLEHLLIVPWTQ